MDIGTLTGQIDIENRVNDVLSTAGSAVTEFAGLFTGAAGTIVSAAALITAAVTGMTITIIELGNRGSDVNDVAATFDKFSGSVDIAEKSLENMREGTKGTVTDFDLMKNASKLLAADVKLTSDQFGIMSKAAFTLQNQGLGPTKDMLDLVSQALLTGRTRTLEMRLGKINLEKATKDYADTIGVEVRQLSEAGKTEARRAAIFELLNRKVSEAGDQQKDFGEKMDSVIVSLKNWGDELASRVAESPAIMSAVDAIGDSLIKAFGGTPQTAIDNIVFLFDKFANTVGYVGPIVIDIVAGIYKEIKGLVEVFKLFVQYSNAIPDWMKTAASNAAHTAAAIALIDLEMKKLMVTSKQLPQISPGFISGGAAAARARDEAANAALGYDKPVQDLTKSTDELIKRVETLRDRVSGVAIQKEAQVWVRALQQTGAAADVLADAKLRKELGGVLDIVELKFGSLKNAGVESLSGLRSAIEATQQKAEMIPPAIIDMIDPFTLVSVATRDWGIENKKTTDTLLAMLAAGGKVFKDLKIDYVALDEEIRKKSFANQISELSDSFTKLAQVSGDAFGGIIKDIANVVVSFDLALKSVEQYKNATTALGKATALVGGIAAVGQATGSGSTGSRILGGAATGAALGSVIPGVGTAVGAIGGALVGLFRGLGSANKEARKLLDETNKLRGAFIDASGGMTILNERAMIAGTTLREVLNAKTPDDYRMAVERLNQAFEFQDAAMQLLDETVAEYGLTLADMGDKYRQSKLNEEFGLLLQKQEILSAAGVNFDLILNKQADSFKSLIATAIETGATIPQELKTAIDRMEELGLFTDEAGNKLFDLSKVNYVETLDSKFNTLLDTIQALVDAIERGLGGAIKSLPKPKAPWEDWPAPPNYPAFETAEPSYYAKGGVVVPFTPRGTDTVPAMLTPGERVVPRGGGGGGTAIIQLDSKTIARAVVPEIPGAVRRYGTGR